MIEFLGIGAQKAGTSWLYEKMSLHPHLAFPGGKEVHFWDKKIKLGIEWYRSRFSGHKFDGKVCGEITPAYSILPIRDHQTMSCEFSRFAIDLSTAKSRRARLVISQNGA